MYIVLEKRKEKIMKKMTSRMHSFVCVVAAFPDTHNYYGLIDGDIFSHPFGASYCPILSLSLSN